MKKNPFFFHLNFRLSLLLSSLLMLFLSLCPASPVFSQDSPETLLYSQNFEQEYAPEWTFETGWTIVPVEDGHALSGTGHTWARLEAGTWSDFRLKFRIHLAPGASTHINIRSSGSLRYFFGLNQQSIYLSKQTAPDTFQGDLASAPGLSSSWHDIEIAADGSTLILSVDQQAVLSYNDLDALGEGLIAFESLTQPSTLIDDIEIWGHVNEAVETATGPAWIRTGGPLGGLGYDVRIHPLNPDRVYVTDAWAGVFISNDGGQTWHPSNEGITTRKGDSQDSIPIFCLTIDPLHSDTIWVGTEHTAHIFKSTNGGELWTDATGNIRNQFFNGLTFRGFTVHPESSDIVYAAAELHSWANGGEIRQGREFEMVEGIVYRTTNGGGSWEEVWRGDNLARYIWINPQNPDVLYISTGIFDREAANSDPVSGSPGGEGILKSTDGGQTWQHANEGLDNLYVGSLFMHPENPDILLAGTGNNQYHEGNGVYLTTNGAETWRHVLPDQNIESVEFAEINPSIAYAGSADVVFRSEDGGETWEQVSGRDWGPDGVRVGFPIDFQVDRRDPNRLFSNAYGGGNFISEDGGLTWEASSKGYTGAQIRAVTVHPEQPGIIYAAARSGLFLSSNGGEDWAGISFPPVKVMEWNAVALNPFEPLHILAGTNWNSDLVISSDGGATWRLTDSGIGDHSQVGVSVLLFAPSDPETVYAATAGYYSAGSFDPSTPGSGIHVSHNGGSTWNSANSSLTDEANIRGLAVHPEDPEMVYAASTDTGLLATLDGGKSWTQLQNGLPVTGSFSVAIQPGNPDRLIAGFLRGGLFTSTNGGNSWHASSSGMPPEASVTSIIFDPVNPSVVYAADIQSGVYQSTNSGESWLVINNGLRTRAVNKLAISSDGAHLYAATEGEGVYRLDLNDEPPEAGPSFLLPGEESPSEEEPPVEEAPGGDAVQEETEPDISSGEGVEAEPSTKTGLCSGVVLFPFGLAGALLFTQRSRDLRSK